jgi:hypothetical protein
MSLGSFSLWSFVAGIIFAMFVLPMILNLFSGRKTAAAK